jgi:bacillopeptidase F
LYAEGFENGNEGWTVGVLEGFSVTDTTWEVGAPSNNGPAAAFAGENVYGTDLDGNYADGTGIYLRSPIIDLTGAGRAKLTFQYFMAAADNEGGRLNILDPDGTPILAGLKLYIGPDGNTADWTGESIRLPELDRPVIIEFELLSGADDDPINRAGWFIDEIIVD